MVKRPPTMLPMATQAPIALTTNIADVTGVGSSSARRYRKISIRCVADLILHLPVRYEHELPEQSIAQASNLVSPAHGAEANIAVCGEIAVVRTLRGRHPRIEATLEDGTGTIKLTWFNTPWMRGQLHPGMCLRVWGKIKRYGVFR